MYQMSLFDDNKDKDKDKDKDDNTKKHRPSHSQTDKIWENIKEWNTIEGIELYKPLYNICSQLFLLTINCKLACLNYYMDEEYEDGKLVTVMYAEIDNTWHLPLKERYNLHKELLEHILKQDIILEYDEKPIDSDNLTLFSFL